MLATAAQALDPVAVGAPHLTLVPPVRAAHPSAAGWQAVAKRVLDLTVAVLALVLVAPFLLAIAAVIRRDGGPVLFRQERVGKDGVPFTVFKLRTMVVDAEARIAELRALNEADGPLFKLRDDPRVTSIGRFLRKTSLDELPQLLNVVRGEMSLVGPRPALPSEVAEWDAELHARLDVKPGITGRWQVSGRSDADFATYRRLDLSYVEEWSILVDLAILLRTIPTVLFARGAY